MDALRERSKSGYVQLRDIVSDQLKQIFISRVVMTLEQRLGQKLGLKIEDLVPAAWEKIEDDISMIIDQRFSKNADLQNQPNHPIIQNLEHVLNKQLDSQGKELNLGALFSEMAVGTQVAIDQETHKRVYRRVNMLNYVFFVANKCLPESPEKLTAEVSAHFKATSQKLLSVWGMMELQRIAENNLAFSQFSDSYKAQIEANLDDSVVEKIHREGLAGLAAEKDEKTLAAFGKNVQQVIYRHILLKAITDLWMEHLTRMEALRVSIRMEAYAQRDPLVQYKSYSTDAFKELLANIRLSVVSKMFRLQPSNPKSGTGESAGQTQTGSEENKKENKKKKGRKRHKKKR